MPSLVNQPFFKSGTHPGACLLLHGLGGGVYEMQPLGDYLNAQGWTVQGIQYPGHDQPLPKMPPSTWQMWYAHVVQSYESLVADYGAVTVIGFSTGGTLALHLAAQQLTTSAPVACLVLLCPYLSLRRPWFLPVPLETLISSVGYLWEDIPRLRLPIMDQQARVEAQKIVFYRTFNLQAVRSAMTLIAQVRTEVPSLNVPTLIVQSCRDTVVNPAEAQWLYDTLPTPHKELAWLKRSDHIIGLDKEKDQVFAQVNTFLQRVIPDAKSGYDATP